VLIFFPSSGLLFLWHEFFFPPFKHQNSPVSLSSMHGEGASAPLPRLSFPSRICATSFSPRAQVLLSPLKYVCFLSFSLPCVYGLCRPSAYLALPLFFLGCFHIPSRAFISSSWGTHFFLSSLRSPCPLTSPSAESRGPAPISSRLFPDPSSVGSRALWSPPDRLSLFLPPFSSDTPLPPATCTALSRRSPSPFQLNPETRPLSSRFFLHHRFFPRPLLPRARVLSDFTALRSPSLL